MYLFINENILHPYINIHWNSKSKVEYNKKKKNNL